MADHIEETLATAGILPYSKQGYQEGDWVLLDYLDFVVHIFIEQAREYYQGGAVMAAGLTGYESLARYYDVLMADLPYRRWIKFIDSFARRTGEEKGAHSGYRLRHRHCGRGGWPGGATGLLPLTSLRKCSLADAKARRAKVDLLLLQCDFNLGRGNMT